MFMIKQKLEWHATWLQQQTNGQEKHGENKAGENKHH